MKYVAYIYLLILVFFSGFSLSAQSLENLEGTYLVKQDGIVHSYEFKNGKLKVRLNLNDAYKVQFTYSYNCTLNKDKTLKVVLIEIMSEELESTGNKKKSYSYIKDLYMMSGYFFSIWTLEKMEGKDFFIKVEPGSIKWPASDGHLSNYYSGFEDRFVLQSIKD